VALRWGILATGTIAKAFARHLPTSATGELVAVASRTADRAKAFADDIGGDVTAHGTYDALLEDPTVDAVYISTPHPMHAAWAIRAAEAGKRVLCEKPLTMNARETETVIDAARAHDVFLMEAFMYRCHPQTQRLVELLQAGVVGEVRDIEAVHSFKGSSDPAGRLLAPALGGGGILDVGCYCVSGARLVAAVVLGDDAVEPLDVEGSCDLAHTGVDRRADATLTFEGGIRARLSCGVAKRRAPLLRITGTAGTISVPAPWLPTLDGNMTTTIHVDHERVEVTAERGLYAYQADVVDAGVATFPAPTTDDTLATMRTLDRWRQAVGVRYEVDPW